MGSKKEKSTLYPDLEVVVRRGATEICTLAFFADEYGGVDVLVGLASLDDRPFLETTFQYSAAALKDADIVARASNEADGGLPF